MKTLSITCLAVFLGGCATTAPDAGPTDATLDPAGSYTFSTTAQGRPVEGRMQITGAPGAWTGSLYTDITGPLTFSSVTVEGRTLFLTADTPDGPVRIQLQFEEGTFTGDWALGAEGGSIRGRRTSG